MENNNNFDNLPSDFNVDMGIDWYIDEIIKQKPDFNDLDEEVLNQIKKDLKPRIENHINMAILKNIPQNKLEDFEKIVDSNDQEKIQAFCNENIPDLKEVIAMALISFRDSYMGDNY